MAIQPVLAHKVFPASMPNKFVERILTNSQDSLMRNGTNTDMEKAAKYLQDISAFTKKKPVFLTALLDETNQGCRYVYHILTNTTAKPLCTFPTTHVHQKPLDTIKLIRDSILTAFKPKA